MHTDMSLSAAVSKFMQWAERHLAAKTVAEYRRYLSRFSRHVGEIAVGELRAHHLVDWGTTWHRIQAVQRCFNWLVEVEYLARSPFNRVKRPRPGRRRRVFTRAEFTRLCRASAADFRRFLFAMRESLARPQEVRDMRMSEINSTDETLPLTRALVEGRCYFLKEKYKSQERRADPDEPRIIPISRRLGRLIDRQMKKRTVGCDVIFRSGRNKSFTKEAIRLRLARARRRLGWNADHRGEQLVAYSIRHTGGTAYTVAGVRDKMLAQIMGHSNTRTTARYQHPQPADVLNAIEGMRPKRTMKPPPR